MIIIICSTFLIRYIQAQYLVDDLPDRGSRALQDEMDGMGWDGNTQ